MSTPALAPRTSGTNVEDVNRRSTMRPNLVTETNVIDLLTEMECRIARRADEIAASVSARTPLNLYCWLQAEQEILARMNFLDRRPEGPLGETG